MNVVAAVFSDGGTQRFIHAGVKGQADLSGVVRVCGVGIRLEVEVKRPGARQHADQLAWEGIMRSFGAIYIVAHSVDEAEQKLETEIAYARERMKERCSGS